METLYARKIDVERAASRPKPETAVCGKHGAEQLLSPASVLPEQFFTRATGGSHCAGGVRALMWAVLEDAITCVQKHALTPSRRHQHLAHEARQWIFADNTSWVFSFLNVCAALELDPEYLRTKLDQWVKRWARPPRQATSRFDVQETLRIAA